MSKVKTLLVALLSATLLVVSFICITPPPREGGRNAN